VAVAISKTFDFAEKRKLRRVLLLSDGLHDRRFNASHSAIRTWKLGPLSLQLVQFSLLRFNRDCRNSSACSKKLCPDIFVVVVVAFLDVVDSSNADFWCPVRYHNRIMRRILDEADLHTIRSKSDTWHSEGMDHHMDHHSLQLLATRIFVYWQRERRPVQSYVICALPVVSRPQETNANRY
jgi:hypothetical protein